ncbi:MAG: NAD-dependent epimerase/dehydratase family protein, partial [Gemmatimonadota bacterium]
LAGEDARVVGVGRRVDESRWLEEEGVDLRRADLLDRQRMREMVAGNDLVIHAAGWLYGDTEMARPVNVEATADLVRMAAEEGVRRVVHVSTLGAYARPDDPDRPIDESHPLAPDAAGAYQRTKAEGEIRSRQVADDRGLELAVLRPGMVFGPRSGTWTVGMCRAVCEGRPVLIGDGKGHFHPLYIDDLVAAVLTCAVATDAAGEAYNPCQEPVTFRSYLSEYGELCGREPASMPTWLARLMALGNRLSGLDFPVDDTWLALATNRLRFSTRKAREELGWEPEVGYEEGLARTKEWLRAQGHV